MSGNYHIPLAKESQPLTSFLTPWGKYCYLRLPQGWYDSGDKFNFLTDGVSKNLDRVIKSVDDLLGQVRSLQEMWDTLAEVLSRIIDRNMVVSLDKF